MNNSKTIQPAYESPHQMGQVSMFLKIVSLYGLLFMGIVITIICIVGMYLDVSAENSVYKIIRSIIQFSIPSAFFLRLGWVFLMYHGAHYCFETDGLHVKYPFRKWRMIPWDCFQQVCVLHKESWSAGRQQIDTAICCVMKGEKKNRFGRWKSHNPFRYRTVIYIAYTPELHEGIKERCPYEVCDLRDTYPYRIHQYKYGN